MKLSRFLIMAVAVNTAAVAHGDSLRISAGARGEVRSVAVSIGDLDLSREPGAQRFLDRAASATRRVCQADDVHDLARLNIVRQCLHDTMDRAVSSVSSSYVQRLYAEEKTNGLSPERRVAIAP